MRESWEKALAEVFRECEEFWDKNSEEYRTQFDALSFRFLDENQPRPIIDEDRWRRTLLNHFFVSAYRNAFLCDRLEFKYKDGNDFDQSKLFIIRLNHALVGAVLLDLFNFRESLSYIHEKQLFQKNFDQYFPNVTLARDAKTHAHDRYFGYYRSKKLPPNEELFMGRTLGCRHEFFDSEGRKKTIDFHPDRFIAFLKGEE